MTVKQAAERLKHAALVLAGVRPAEVRFNESDRRIASSVAARWARFSYGSLRREDREDIEMTISAAISEYTAWEKDAWLRVLDRDATDDNQMILPFWKAYEQPEPGRPSA